MKQFWTFGKTHQPFMPLEQVLDLIELLGKILKLIKEDKHTRLEQFKSAKKKMDEEDIEYFHEDIRKIDKIENCKKI
jgi:hypothetical protein